MSDILIDFLQWVEDNPGQGAVAFAAVYIFTTVCFIPGSLLTLGAGLVFGRALGTGWGVLVGSLAVLVSAWVSRCSPPQSQVHAGFVHTLLIILRTHMLLVAIDAFSIGEIPGVLQRRSRTVSRDDTGHCPWLYSHVCAALPQSERVAKST